MNTNIRVSGEWIETADIQKMTEVVLVMHLKKDGKISMDYIDKYGVPMRLSEITVQTTEDDIAKAIELGISERYMRSTRIRVIGTARDKKDEYKDGHASANRAYKVVKMEIDNIKDRIAIKRAVDGLVGLNIKSPDIPDEIKSEMVEVMKSAFGILGTPI